MRLAVLSCLLAIPLCACAPAGGGIDLTLRLGPPSSTHSPATSESSTSTAEHAAEQPVRASWQGQPARDPAVFPVEGSLGAIVQNDRGASAISSYPYVPRLRTIDPGNTVEPQVRARHLWEHYTRYHLNTPVPAIIQDGRFHPENARLFQRRIESLVRAKTLFVKIDRGRSFSKDEMELLTRRFLNWRKVAKHVAPYRDSVFANRELQGDVAENIRLLERDEELLRRVAH